MTLRSSLLGPWLVAALVVGCTDGAGDAATVPVDRVHDLIAALDVAEATGTSPYARRADESTVASVDEDDPRDALAFLRAPTGSSLTWRGLRVGDGAHFEAELGVGWTRQGESGRARMTVEVLDEADAGGGWTALVDEVVDCAELPRPRRARPVSADWPEGRGPWSLRLGSEAVGEDAVAREWPAFLSPRVVSSGVDVPVAQIPIATYDLRVDMLGELPGATVVSDVADAPVAPITIDPAVGVVQGGGQRPTLRVAPGARVRFVHTAHSGEALTFAVGVDEVDGWRRAPRGVRFGVDVDGEGVWTRRLDPRDRRRDRGWHAGRVDLAPWVDESVAIELWAQAVEGEGRAPLEVGFGAPGIERRDRVPRALDDERPFVLVVLVDTLRADRLAVGGRRDGLMSNVDAFAARGVTFTQARSATSWTWPSVGSLFTGLYPVEHGVYKHRGYHLDEGLVTLAERFQQHGYTTAAFVASVVIGSFDNFDQGFETFVQTPMARARAVNERVVSWLDDTEGLARFAYVHYFDPHAPYNAPGHETADDVARSKGLLRELFEQKVAGEVDETTVEEWMAIRRPAYDEEVRVFDAAFGELLDELERRDLLDDAVVVFTSDHGEEFYEHGWIDHGPNVYDETMLVPLTVAGFGARALAPRVVDTPVEARRVAPTLVEWLGLPGEPARGWGPSLLAESSSPEIVFGQTDHGLLEGGTSYVEKFFALRDGWKLVHTPAAERTELYHLPTDPRERDDRAAEQPDLVADLAARLEAWRESTWAARRGGPGKGLDARSIEMMEALGYLDAAEEGR